MNYHPKLILNEEQQHFLNNIKQYTKNIRNRREVFYYEYDKNSQKSTWKRYPVLVVSVALGRNIFRNEETHHIDGDTTNNKISNLCVMKKVDHMETHCSLQKCCSRLYKMKLIDFDVEKKSLLFKIKER
jgi:hypothetical protein